MRLGWIVGCTRTVIRRLIGRATDRDKGAIPLAVSQPSFVLCVDDEMAEIGEMTTVVLVPAGRLDVDGSQALIVSINFQDVVITGDIIGIGCWIRCFTWRLNFFLLECC